MIALMGTLVLTAQSALGLSGHHASQTPCCDVCGVEKAEVSNLLVALQTCPQWRGRREAAHDVRKYDWRCHPEIIDGLASALLNDCDEDVREEAAVSLKKLGACTPAAHAALQRAATCDADWATRFWAKRALAAVKRKCGKGCDVCQPGMPLPGATVMMGEPALGSPVLPDAVDAVTPYETRRPPGTALVPPADIPPPAPNASPFIAPAPAPRGESRDAAPKLEGPIREGKRAEPAKRSKLVKLIPGLRTR